MPLALSQKRLNVSTKTRSNLFNWRGQFTPEFVEYLLRHFSVEAEFVVDPFSGSGTVLHGSLSAGLRTAGMEINPSAYAMSRFFTFSMLSPRDRKDLLSGLEVALSKELKLRGNQKVYTESPDYRVAYSSLLGLGRALMNDLSKAERVLLLNCLFLSEKDKRLSLQDSLHKSLSFLQRALVSLPHAERPVEAHLDDARSVGKRFPGDVDLILTSPPYINVFNYHQNYRAFVELFEFDLLKVASSEFGSNRKNRGNRFRTVIQYALDMEETLVSMWKALRLDAHLIMVLGRESNVRGIPFQNGQIVCDLFESLDGFQRIDVLEREFVNKFGVVIKEDILVYRRTSSVPVSGGARTIARRYLDVSLPRSAGEVRVDLENAIRDVDLIESSPLFSPNGVAKNA